MSSTSSSECMCSECFNYTSAFRSPSFRTRAPYYQNLGHPFIYYAQVPTPNFRQRSRDSRKDNPNCFVKAFRWYTQDHYPPQSRELPSDRTDLTGFAMWLDKKYDEFMLERLAEQDDFQRQPRASRVEQDANKIPFRKRRRQTSFIKECGDTPDKCDHSFEYILKPKELSRAASECCNQIPSEMQASKRTIVKMRAHSSERTVHEKSNSVPIEIIKIEGSNRSKTTSNSLKTETKTVEYAQPKAIKSKSSTKSVKYVSCQCPEKRMVTLNAQTQCECDLNRKPRADYSIPVNAYCPNCAQAGASTLKYSVGTSQVREDETELRSISMSKKYNAHEKFVSEMTSSSRLVEKRDAQNQYRRDNKSVECYCTMDDDDLVLSSETFNHQVKDAVLVSSMIACPCSNNPVNVNRPALIIRETVIQRDGVYSRIDTDAAQTSDHSICLEGDGYPLFMKIICADKLNDDLSQN